MNHNHRNGVVEDRRWLFSLKSNTIKPRQGIKLRDQRVTEVKPNRV